MHINHFCPYAGVAKVAKLGKGVNDLKEGLRVVGVPFAGLHGCWQQYRTAPADALVGRLAVGTAAAATAAAVTTAAAAAAVLIVVQLMAPCLFADASVR